MPRVYIGCFGSGLGHAARMLQVAEALAVRGDEIRFSSSTEVASLIRSRGYECNELPLADVRYSDEGAFSLRETMVASPTIVGRTMQQQRREVSNLRIYNPQVVLSDSSLPTVLAAKILRLPVFTVLNQLNLTGSNGSARAPSRLLSAGITAGMGLLWELSNEVLLPDLPPPFTISERNLWGSNVANARYIGFLSMSGKRTPDPAARSFSTDSRPKIFWQVSGPPRTREPFVKRAMEIARELGGRFTFVVSGGDPTGSSVPRRIDGGWYYDWCQIPELYFASCDAVVSRAGHNTISQAIAYSKPSLLVPIPKQPEQEGNGLKAEALGVSKVVPQGDLTAARASDTLESLLRADSLARASRLGEYASRFNAVEEIVRTLHSAAR